MTLSGHRHRRVVWRPWGCAEFVEIARVTFRYQLCDEPPASLSGRRLLAVVKAGEIVHGSLPFLNIDQSGGGRPPVPGRPIDVASLRQQVADALASAGLPELQIEINLVNSLERHNETGKLRWFIPLKH